MLRFENVTFGYGGGPESLRGVSFAVQPGEWVALMGANGSGKSTAAKLACGLLQPSEGRVFSPRVGYVAQDPEANIVGDRVFDDVACSVAGEAHGPDLVRRVEACLGLVGLFGYGERLTRALSGGELQRVAVAAALASEADLIVLDEPTSHLPRQEGLAFLRDLRQAAKARLFSLLLVTHRPEEARFADRVVVLARGRIALEGPPEEVLSRPGLLAALGVSPDLALCVERLLGVQRAADPAVHPRSSSKSIAERSAGRGGDYERLVELVCSALKR